MFFAILGSFAAEHSRQKEDKNLRTYASTAFGLSFAYPSRYFLEEKDFSTRERLRYAIVLTEDTEENRFLREGKLPPGREGPTAITIDLFQNNLDRYTTEEWIRGTNDSNFKLSPDGALSPAKVGGKNALRYGRSGLYEGESVVLAGPNFLYMFSATRLAPDRSFTFPRPFEAYFLPGVHRLSAPPYSGSEIWLVP